MPQSVTVTSDAGPQARLTMRDVPPGGWFLSADGDVCLRSNSAGHIVTNLTANRVWLSRRRYESIRRSPNTIMFDGQTPVLRLLSRGERVVVEVQ